MNVPESWIFRCATSAAALALLSACSAGPSDGEFEAACLKEGERGVNRAVRRNMGVDSAAFCKCAAAQAASTLSSDGRRVMILEMQGNKREAREISSRMSQPDQAALIQGTVAVLEHCSESAAATAGVASPARTSPVPASSAPKGAAFAPTGRYRAEYAGESITLEFRGGHDVRVILADRHAVQDTAQGRYEVQGDRVTVSVPGGDALVLTRRGDALEGVMDGDKVRFERR